MDMTTKVRVKTAIIAAFVVFPFLIWGNEVNVFGLVLLAFLLGARELASLITTSEPESYAVFVWGLSVGTLCLIGLIFVPSFTLQTMIVVGCGFYVYFGSIFAFLNLQAFKTIDRFHPLLLWMWLTVGLAGVLVIRLAPSGYLWLWYLLLTVWLTDSGAYFAGRAWGKKKMAPNISPGKTWAGFHGGVFLGTLGGTLFGLQVGLSTSLVTLECVTFFLSLLSVTGDLFESLLKRAAGVKDTGTLLPGHGGVLDRLDSILYASPALAGLLLFL